jgi:23S rRNA (cytosine1962-C5)-methyltransferase
MYKALTLKRGKEKALERKHPWVFSGAFEPLPPHLEEGEIVRVVDGKGRFRGMGFYRPGSITVMLFSFEEVTDVAAFLQQKLEAAIAYRKNLGFFDDPDTNCCRLVFGEGDGLPGLIIDRYAQTAVIQLHQRAWLPFQEMLAETLVKSGLVQQVYSKPSEKTGLMARYLIDAHLRETEVQEHGHRFKIDWEGGQKTGFFIDQRENRQRLGMLAREKSVLNTFSYTGGFSIYALAQGAKNVVSVDLSEAAIALANDNAELNGYAQKHRGVAADVFDFLKAEGDQYDIIVLDPPAFSKSKRTAHNAVQAYKRLNLLALKKIKPGGLLFSFSCSQHVSPTLFTDTLRAAAIESGREVRIVEKLIQPADHPINIYFPEGEYLKGVVLEVE